MPIGYSDLQSVLYVSPNIDWDYLRKVRLADGKDWASVVTTIGAGLVLFNRSLTAGYWGRYLQITTEVDVEYYLGGSGSELEEVTEGHRPDPVHGADAAHMIPMKDYGGALGWTYFALRRMKAGKVTRDIKELIERSENTWEKRILERLFKLEADTVGSTGKSLPFADGGATDAAYIPPSFEGHVFDATHNHYDRDTWDAAGRTSFLATAMSHLKHHGIMGPYELVIPDTVTDKAAWIAQAEFVSPAQAAILTAGVEKRGVVGVENGYIGIVETGDGWAYVKPVARLQTQYAGMFKPATFNTTSNPLIVRYEDGYPLGLTMVAENKTFPLQDAIMYFTFGVGIANRVAGYCGEFDAAGNYSTPTIT